MVKTPILNGTVFSILHDRRFPIALGLLNRLRNGSYRRELKQSRN